MTEQAWEAMHWSSWGSSNPHDQWEAGSYTSRVHELLKSLWHLVTMLISFRRSVFTRWDLSWALIRVFGNTSIKTTLVPNLLRTFLRITTPISHLLLISGIMFFLSRFLFLFGNYGIMSFLWMIGSNIMV